MFWRNKVKLSFPMCVILPVFCLIDGLFRFRLLFWLLLGLVEHPECVLVELVGDLLELLVLDKLLQELLPLNLLLILSVLWLRVVVEGRLGSSLLLNWLLLHVPFADLRHEVGVVSLQCLSLPVRTDRVQVWVYSHSSYAFVSFFHFVATHVRHGHQIHLV